MDPVVMAAGTALVAAIATDAWAQARKSAVDLWRRFRPGDAPDVESGLEETRAQVVVAREAADGDIEEALVGSWRMRLHQLALSDPEAIPEIRRVLDDELRPLLRSQDEAKVASIVIVGRASDNATLYQAGRDIRTSGQDTTRKDGS
ncbi:hypothetical protein ACIGMX_41695 [Streptomyces aquilus]|uniref:hypothetical protein n=1 Tax=Streptomyces aquilus TaxID=2548456 RepID=UPI0037D11B34